VPKTPISSIQRRSWGLCLIDSDASASIATRPPSPLLSARSTSVTYLSEMMTVSVQTKIDSTP